MTDPRTVVAAAWDKWLATEEHLYQCIGYSEGQRCCAQAADDPTQPVGERCYDGAQDKLLDLAFDALTSAGFQLSGGDDTVSKENDRHG